jgi:hypothetical protein
MILGARVVGLLGVGAALMGMGTGCARTVTAPREDTETRPRQEEAKQRCGEDPNRYYVSRDPEQCAVIRFVCPNPNDTPPPIKPNFFSDSCGCGCEADS